MSRLSDDYTPSTPSGSSSLTPTAVKTAAYTAVVGDIAMMNVAGGATALTLPTAPADKAQVGYRAIGATTAVPLTVTAGGSDTIGTAGAPTASIALADEVVILQYQASSTRWLGVSNVKTQVSLDGRYAPLVDPTLEVTTLNENFTRSDGAPGTDPRSGYSWTASGASPPTITSNKLVASAHPGTSYGQVYLQRAPIEMRGTLSFVTGGGSDSTSAQLVLASSSVNNQASPAWYLVHVQYSQTGYQIQKAINNTFTTLASGNWTTAIPLDGTVKSVKWRLVGSTLTLTGPNGETATVTDSDFAWLNGRYCFWSIEPLDANSPKGRWHTATATEGRPVNPLYGPRPQDLWIPDNGICASLDPGLGTVSNLTPLTSGTVYCTRLTLPGGVPINWLEWWSTGTAAGTPVNQWAALLDMAGRIVAISSDLTTTAWAANSKQRFTITSVESGYASTGNQFVPPGPMPVWAALMVKATTVPSLVGIGSGGGTAPQNNAPNPAGASTTGQTTPPAVGAFLAKPSVTASGIPLCVAG